MSSRYEDKVFCDKTDKLELLIKNNLFINIGFISFLNRCMKGFDRIIINHTKKTTLKEYISRVFPVKNLDNIMLKIKNKKINDEDYFHIESMLNTYMIENKIKKIREECKLSYLLSNQKKIFYNDHGHFMRMMIAMSFIKRFTVNEILQMAHIYFDYIHANISHLNNFNKKFNLKCDFNIFKDYIEYHKNFDFFFNPYDPNVIENTNNTNNTNKVKEDIIIIDFREIENQIKIQMENNNLVNDNNNQQNITNLNNNMDIEKNIEEENEYELNNLDDLNISDNLINIIEQPSIFENNNSISQQLNRLSVKFDLNENIPIRTGRKSPICTNFDIYSLEYLRSRLNRYSTLYN